VLGLRDEGSTLARQHAHQSSRGDEVADTIAAIGTLLTVVVAAVAAWYAYRAAAKSAQAAERANELMSEANHRMLEANALAREQIDRAAYEKRTGRPYGERATIRNDSDR
jgi:hypothetical protein